MMLTILRPNDPLRPHDSVLQLSLNNFFQLVGNEEHEMGFLLQAVK